jgi:hypothetical protein
MLGQLTEFEKTIYNKHLAVSRILKNKPFKRKQDFSDIINTDKHKFLYRISTLFKKHPEVDQDLFFQAPYKLYSDVEYFSLEYFASMRAIKSYTLYKKTLFLQDPDKQIESVKESLCFISNFCIQNKIYFHQYIHHRTTDVFTWMIHYKQNKINLYSLFEFPDLFSSLDQLVEETQKFFIGEFVEQFNNLHSLYNNSTKLKDFLKKAIPSVENFIYKQIKNS